MKKANRVNILFTNASAFSLARQIGGGEVHLLSLISKLNREKYKIFVAYPGPGPLEELLKKESVTPLRVTSLRGKWEPLCVLELMCLIQRHSIDIVHSYEPKSGFWAMMAANLLGVPGKIYTVHLPCFTPYWKETGFQWARDKIRYVRDTLTSCMADRIIAVSEEIAREKIGRQGISSHKVETVLNGVEGRKFSPKKKAQGRLKEQFNIPKEARLVGVVARLEPHKGHLCLLEAMQAVVEKIPDVWLLVIGEGWYEETVRDAVWEYGLDKHVVFTGFQKDMVNVLLDLDLVVLPSMYESTNLSLIEGMLMEKAVVASAIPSHGPMIEDGVNGFLVPPGNAESLAAAMTKVLTDRQLAASMGRRGRKIALEQFSLDRMAEQTERVYEHALGSREE